MGEYFGEFGTTNVIRQYFTQLNSIFFKVAIYMLNNYAIVNLPRFSLQAKTVNSPKFYLPEFYAIQVVVFLMHYNNYCVVCR